MKPVFVIGNGSSRLQFDVAKLKQYGRVIGCNAIYRDFIPDCLVAVDVPMINEILDSGVQRQCCFIIEETDSNETYRIRPSVNAMVTNIPGLMDSGTLALLAATKYTDTIYMIGFDYTTNNGKFNNVYAGTTHYKRKDEPHVRDVTEQSWYYRHLIVMLRHPNIEFIRVNNNNYKTPLREYNFQNISPENFHERYPVYDPSIKLEQLPVTPVKRVRKGTPGVINHSVTRKHRAGA